ncbi:MAG: hypothetical protein ACFFFB_14180 [Candidatus Heimdallarchaeota archaeon]
MFRPETKELIQVNQLLEEGKVKEAFHVILELEKRGDLSPKELLLYKLVKAHPKKRCTSNQEISFLDLLSAGHGGGLRSFSYP